MQRARVASKNISAERESQLPSKARPMRRLLPSKTGEPELPPVMSLLVRKQRFIVPLTGSLYCPKSFAEKSSCITGSA